MLSKGAVGISVRRGDYFRTPHTHPFVGRKFLREAVDRFRDSGKEKANFIVCSDGMIWCKLFFNKRRFPWANFIFIEERDPLFQLFIHSMCTHNIISNSTYSWWGAYLNPNPNKRTIAPSMWLGFAIRPDFMKKAMLETS